jgi:hypothetical protein
MITINEILNNNVFISQGTDKHTRHDYVNGFYEDNFKKYQTTAKNVLEIGVCWGGSIALWKNYFTDANIFAVDIEYKLTFPVFKNIEEVKYFQQNAYTEEFLNLIPNMDIIVDDGPHTLESMKYVVQNYSKKVNTGGIIVIEDVQDISWTMTLLELVPSNFSAEIIDLRHRKNVYDDILFVMRKLD